MTDLELNDLFAKNGKVDLKTGCWNWTKGKNGKGYGFAWVDNKSVKVSRLSAYLYLGFDLDPSKLVLHKCNNKACFNSEHLYIGTDSDNKFDSVKDGTHINSSKTHCPEGHEYTSENTYLDKIGSRHCRLCRAEGMRLYRAGKNKTSLEKIDALFGPPIVKNGLTVRYRL